MNQLPCELIRDLLPLEADAALCAVSSELVQEHLKNCESCRQEYEQLKQELPLPCNPDLQAESEQALKSIKQNLLWKRIAVAAISALLTFAIVLLGLLPFQNIGAVHNFWDPSIHATLRDQAGRDWQPLTFTRHPSGTDSSSTLNFNSLFFSRDVVNDANSDGPITLRVLDEKGNVVLDSLTVQPGRQVPLKKLQRFADYQVEFKTNASFVFLNFI